MLGYLIAISAVLLASNFVHAQTATQPRAAERLSRTDAFTDLLKALDSADDTGLFPSQQLSRLLVHVASGQSDLVAEKRIAAALDPLGFRQTIVSTDLLGHDNEVFFGTDRVALEFEVDTQQLVQQASRIVNAYADQPRLLEEILDGVKRDPNGPRLDVQNDLLNHLGARWIVVNDTSSKELRWFAAVSLRNKGEVSRAVYRSLRREPDARLAGRSFYRVGQFGVVILEQWLLFGEMSFVQQAAQEL